MSDQDCREQEESSQCGDSLTNVMNSDNYSGGQAAEALPAPADWKEL
jgi:hypothetical protein